MYRVSCIVLCVASSQHLRNGSVLENKRVVSNKQHKLRGQCPRQIVPVERVVEAGVVRGASQPRVAKIQLPAPQINPSPSKRLKPKQLEQCKRS